MTVGILGLVCFTLRIPVAVLILIGNNAVSLRTCVHVTMMITVLKLIEILSIFLGESPSTPARGCRSKNINCV